LVTQLSVLFFISALVVVWIRDYQSFPRLARKVLCLAPFLPLVSLLNHNIDHDRWGTATRVLPMYVALLLLLLSLLVWRARGAALRWGSEEFFVLLYIGFCAAQIPGSPDWAWALCTWSWSVPGYLLFLMAGRATGSEEFSQDRSPVWTLVGFAAISVALIVTGLLTGRADELFNTRNFGSIYASTAMLMFLTLFVGFCWITVRKSVAWSFTILLVSVLAMLLSLSRTATLTLAVYLLVVLTGSGRDWKRAAWAGTLVLGTLGAGTALAGKRFDLDAQLFEVWSARFFDGDYAGAYDSARELRDSKFFYFHEQVWREVPWRGQGFGTFRHFSDYTDAHNLLVTEAFENSLLAALFLVLAYSFPKLIQALFRAELRPVAVSILGFILLGQLTGGMLAFRAEGAYYTAYPGWTLFYLVGFISGQLRLRSQPAGTPVRDERPLLNSGNRPISELPTPC
jgi:hypothetical protein